MTALKELLDAGLPERLARQIAAVEEAKEIGEPLPDTMPGKPGELKPRRPTGQELFDSMTKADQDELFGAEKAEALREGTIELADLVDRSADDFITEKPLVGLPIPAGKRFDPNQPRDPHTGEWIDVPGGDVPLRSGREALHGTVASQAESGDQLAAVFEGASEAADALDRDVTERARKKAERAIYEHTQASLKRRGIPERTTVYRVESGRPNLTDAPTSFSLTPSRFWEERYGREATAYEVDRSDILVDTNAFFPGAYVLEDEVWIRPSKATPHVPGDGADLPPLPDGFERAEPVKFHQTGKVVEHAWNDESNEHVVLDENSDEWVPFEQWIYDIDPDEFVGYQDQVFNDEFWAGVEARPGSLFLYHGTSNEAAEEIEAEGLLERDVSRGISNRSTGPAIFATRDTRIAEEYSFGGTGGPGSLVTIDVGAMKADGFTPFLTGEEPLMEVNARDSIAWQLEEEDFHDESADYDGIEPETVVIRADIPPKYLGVLKAGFVLHPTDQS